MSKPDSARATLLSIHYKLRRIQDALVAAPDLIVADVREQVSGLRRILKVAVALFTVFVAILLTACATPIPHRSEPVPAQCDARCYQPCDTTIPPWRPADPDSPAAWDELPDQVLIPARALLESCEAHRKACARCLDRLREAEVIR